MSLEPQTTEHETLADAVSHIGTAGVYAVYETRTSYGWKRIA